MFVSTRINRYPTTMGTFSSDKELRHSYTAFYTDILYNLRHRKQDYVFSMEQIEILKGRLKPHEEIAYTESDGSFIVRLQFKGAN